jgi:hypothetical protein
MYHISAAAAIAESLWMRYEELSIQIVNVLGHLANVIHNFCYTASIVPSSNLSTENKMWAYE